MCFQTAASAEFALTQFLTQQFIALRKCHFERKISTLRGQEMRPKPTQIEFGNLLRGADKPILIKEKTNENGEIVLRIYQRKDLQSISSPFERIKNRLKYSLEDFGREHKIAAKLLDKIGFGKVRVLQTKGTKDPANLLEKMRSGARTGLIDQKIEREFNNLLNENSIKYYSGFCFYEDNYSDQNFDDDLKYILSNANICLEVTLSNDIESLENDIHGKFFEDPLNHLKEIDSLFDSADSIRQKFKFIFEKNKANDQIQKAFLKKLEQTFKYPINIAFGAQNTRDWLLQYEQNLGNVQDNADDQDLASDQKTAIHNINSAFSNHWWESDKKKIESLANLYDRYDDSENVPKIIKSFILFSADTLFERNPDLIEKSMN